ncbi:hypothetical protein [Bacillus pinisoli]|uniref:hypothetical protein n=1 Tax=Bacillus pinisoli TaxID=2901866 RepID=UPI001FF323B3|nr:hypothetical protein [Bacillus pinisoli]
MSKISILVIVLLMTTVGCTHANPSPPAETSITNTNVTTAPDHPEQQTTNEQLIGFNDDPDFEDDSLSVIEAESLVHDYLNLEAGSDTIVMFDSELENGDYLIYVYDLLEEDKGTNQHKNEGWYRVNPTNGEIEKYQKK